MTVLERGLFRDPHEAALAKELLQHPEAPAFWKVFLRHYPEDDLRLLHTVSTITTLPVVSKAELRERTARLAEKCREFMRAIEAHWPT